MTHQQNIVLILQAILVLPKETKQTFKKGNPFDKLLRSYDEFNALGKPLYRNNRGSQHYKMSQKAFDLGLEASKLYGEHRVPLSIIRNKLL